LNYPELSQDVAEEFLEAQYSIPVDLRRGQGYRIFRSLRALRRDPRARPFVDQYGARYETLNDAHQRVGVNKGLALKVLRGERRQTKGYRFVYA